MSTTYIRVRLFNVPANMEDVVTTHSFESGATGVAEALAFSQPDLTYDPDILHVRMNDLDVFFETQPEESFYTQLKEWMPTLRWDAKVEEHKDWLHEWKKGFVPFQIVGPYWVVPSWHETPPEATKPLKIDPGMAFGTGTHATTKMAAYFVHKLGMGLKDAENLNFLDVGTGTGILAMMAKKEGIGQVVGLEIDPEARRVARENIALNELEIEVRDQLVEEIEETFDFVVANIIDGVLIKLRDHLVASLKPTGQLFLTGILLEREEEFFREFIELSGLEMVRRIEKDEWVGFWLRNNETIEAEPPAPDPS